MSSFTVNYYTAEGDFKKRTVDADSANAAEAVLRAEGLHPTSVRESARLDRRRYRTHLTPAELIDIYLHLELHFRSGILAIDALQSLKDSSPSKNTRLVLREIHQSVYHSKLGLSAAFAQFPNSFPPAVVTMIEAGEGGGALALADVFADIRGQLEFTEASKALFRRGITYPALLCAFATGLVIFMMTFFVPRMAKLLRELDGKMPEITQRVIQVGQFCGQHWVFVVFACLSLPLAIRLIRLTQAGAMFTDKFALKLPLFGPIYRDLATATVTKYYASLKRAGKQPGETLELCERLFSNRALRAEIAGIRRNVMVRSMTLAKAFGLSDFFPKDAVVLIGTGEKTANLESAMERLSEFHSRRAKDKITRALFWMEPIIIVGLGIIIGTVLVALLTPLFTAINSINF